MKTLDIAIPTHGTDAMERIEKLILPYQEGITYRISWQNHDNAKIPVSLKERTDVLIYRFDGSGVASNRNNALERCNANIVYMADDDLIFKPEAFNDIINEFEKDPQVDFILFRVKLDKEKEYPEDGTPVEVPFPKNYYVNCMEIAYLRDKAPDLRFWPELGIGSREMTAGEEELFAIALAKRGLKGKFVNNYLSRHSGKSTGDSFDKGTLKAIGFITATIYPLTAYLRLLKTAMRLYGKGSKNIISNFSALAKGAWRSYSDIEHLPKKYRW